MSYEENSAKQGSVSDQVRVQSPRLAVGGLLLPLVAWEEEEGGRRSFQVKAVPRRQGSLEEGLPPTPSQHLPRPSSSIFPKGWAAGSKDRPKRLAALCLPLLHSWEGMKCQGTPTSGPRGGAALSLQGQEWIALILFASFPALERLGQLRSSKAGAKRDPEKSLPLETGNKKILNMLIKIIIFCLLFSFKKRTVLPPDPQAVRAGRAALRGHCRSSFVFASDVASGKRPRS